MPRFPNGRTMAAVSLPGLFHERQIKKPAATFLCYRKRFQDEVSTGSNAGPFLGDD